MCDLPQLRKETVALLGELKELSQRLDHVSFPSGFFDPSTTPSGSTSDENDVGLTGKTALVLDLAAEDGHELSYQEIQNVEDQNCENEEEVVLDKEASGAYECTG